MEHPEDKLLRLKKSFKVSLQHMWEVWTNAEHIARWWGPEGFSNSIHQMDLKEGGEWRLTMHAPDGTNYPNRSVFKEILPLKKIQFEHFNPHFITSVFFEFKDGETHVDWQMLFDTADMRETVVKAHHADEGQKQNMERLARYLIGFK